MPAKPTTVAEHLATLSDAERATVQAVRKVVNDHLDRGVKKVVPADPARGAKKAR